MARRRTAAVLMLTLLGVAGVPCAGWAATPESRHDCCLDGQCPGQLEAAGHAHDVTQADADRCCATSEERQQQRSAQFMTATFVVAIPAGMTSPMFGVVRPPAPRPPDLIPLSSPPARLHLLFSVFLV